MNLKLSKIINPGKIGIPRFTTGTVSVLKGLSRDLGKDIDWSHDLIEKRFSNLSHLKASYLAIDHLLNLKISIDNTLVRKDILIETVAFVLIDEQIEETETILKSEILSESKQATRIIVRALNHLFQTRQKLKEKFSLMTKIEIPQKANGNQSPHIKENKKHKIQPAEIIVAPTPKMVIPSVLLHQIFQSLFPAEKMLVGAGRRDGEVIKINAVFDVTGESSLAGVRAEPRLLSRALIAMSETDNYFALWIHSHPGHGPGSTHPSNIDRNQETEWLRNYSANLVNAIMVEDRYVRFWGQSLENERVNVKITGSGVKKNQENIYKLES